MKKLTTIALLVLTLSALLMTQNSNIKNTAELNPPFSPIYSPTVAELNPPFSSVTSPTVAELNPPFVIAPTVG